MAQESCGKPAGFFDFNTIGEELPSFGRPYLATYYAGTPQHDEVLVANFLVELIPQFKLPPLGDGKVHYLDAACGPTVHHTFPFATSVDALWLADYLPDNREEVELWSRGSEQAFSWSHFTELYLRKLGRPHDSKAILAHEALTRSKIHGVLHCNFLERDIFSPPRQFSAIGCFYGTEEVGTTKEAWGQIVENVTRSLVPGGVLFLAILGDTEAYRVGDTTLPCAKLKEPDVRSFFTSRPDIYDTTAAVIREEQLLGQEGDGLHTVILVAVRKR